MRRRPRRAGRDAPDTTAPASAAPGNGETVPADDRAPASPVGSSPVVTVRHGKLRERPRREPQPDQAQRRPRLTALIRYVLTILWVTVKRMVKNWRLLGALLAGLVLVAGLAAAVPIYTAAGLQRSFFEHWREQDDFRPPFAVIVAHRNNRRRAAIDHGQLQRLFGYLDRELARQIGQSPIATSFYASFGNDFLLLNESADPSGRATRAELTFMSNLVDHADIIDGRWFAPRDDGVVELVADSKTLDDLEMIVGQRYVWAYQLQPDEEVGGLDLVDYDRQRYAVVPVEVVGLFRPEDGVTTREWIYPPLPGRLFMLQATFEQLQLAGLRTSTFDLQWVFEDRTVRVDQVGALIDDLQAIEERAARIAPGTDYWLAPLEYFQRFKATLDQVSLFLFALAAPTIGMILVYVMLIAALAVERRVSEISVLHSRGAGRAQVLASFALEWLLLAVVAAIVGPYLGMVIGGGVGNAQGFLDFTAEGGDAVRRLPIAITAQSRRFAVMATAVAVLAAVAPVLASSRFSIVTLRQQQARGLRGSFWHRYFVDVILLALAFYGYSNLRWQSTRLAPDATVAADPILFLVPVAFFIGGGLLVLRLYPLAMAGLSWLSSRFRGVVWQLTFRRLSRNTGQYVSLLVLLILTVAMGIYSGSAARTLLVNFEDRVRYEMGADLVIREAWEPPDTGAPGPGASTPPPSGPDQPRPTAEAEPPFLLRHELPGVENATRVMMRRVEARRSSQHLGSATMLAIDPHEFARTAWFRSDLFDPHFYDYLSQLVRHREGAIISSAAAARAEIQPGDQLTISYNNQPIEVYVVGVTPYWPSLDPTRRPFIIANLDHVQDFTALEPYDSWYQLSSREHIAAIEEGLVDIGVWATDVLDTEQVLADLHREPYRRGFFGILTIGFLAAVVVAMLAFVVYTIYTTRERLIQFGALRANGLSLLQTLGVVGLEQLFTVGVGLAIGIGAGDIATRLFLPFLRDRASEVQPVPPFIVVTDFSDLTRIAAVLGVVFVVGIVGLSLFLVRTRLASALRLGEEG